MLEHSQRPVFVRVGLGGSVNVLFAGSKENL